jgi:hypothetical protein
VRQRSALVGLLIGQTSSLNMLASSLNDLQPADWRELAHFLPPLLRSARDVASRLEAIETLSREREYAAAG